MLGTGLFLGSLWIQSNYARAAEREVSRVNRKLLAGELASRGVDKSTYETGLYTLRMAAMDGNTEGHQARPARYRERQDEMVQSLYEAQDLARIQTEEKYEADNPAEEVNALGLNDEETQTAADAQNSYWAFNPMNYI